jgi:ATP-dependent Clp protease ATP-binding subunit ClpA
MNARTGIAPDVALVLGIASTALPFARTAEDEAERWLRVLHLHGEVGSALQELGVSEGRVEEAEIDEEARGLAASIHDSNAIERVTEHATRIASERGAQIVTTTDVLLAVMDVYGPEFDRVLRAHGTNRAEVIEQLGGTDTVRAG